jgi:hypothetical protein
LALHEGISPRVQQFHRPIRRVTYP